MYKLYFSNNYNKVLTDNSLRRNYTNFKMSIEKYDFFTILLN